MNKRRDRISARQLGALILTGAGVPIFGFCCRVDWLWTLLGALAAALTLSGLTLLLNRRRGKRAERARRRGFLAPIPIGGAVLAAWAGSYAFPETAGSWLAALLLFGLAVWAARLGPSAAARCAGILLWVSCGLYGSVLLFSLPQIRTQWLLPTADSARAVLWVWAALLLPGAALCLAGTLGEDQRLPHWPWWIAALVAVLASVVTGGILSPALAGERDAFRTLARGVSVLGVMRRFEALVNGAMLMSAFCLCTMLLTVAGVLGKKRRADDRSRS